MPICVFYYGQSVADIDALTKSPDVKYIVLNKGFDLTYRSVIQTLVDKAHANHVSVLGYVDSGSANMPTSPPYHPTDSLSGPCGSGSYTGCSCSIITRPASKPIVNESGGYWNHRVYDSADFDLSKGSYYSWYFPYTYCGGSTSYNLRKQSAATKDTSCATMCGYMKEHVDQWLKPKNQSGYGANGIMFDNCYAGSFNGKASASDSRYVWYKKICTDVHKRYPGSIVLLNNGNSAPPQWWFTLESGNPFFDLMNIGEVPFNGSETNFPPNYGPGGKFPPYVLAKTYQKYFVSVLQGAKGISAAHTQNWYKACKASGIQYGFISTGSYGHFDLKPANLPDQFTAAAANR